MYAKKTTGQVDTLVLEIVTLLSLLFTSVFHDSISKETCDKLNVRYL